MLDSPFWYLILFWKDSWVGLDFSRGGSDMRGSLVIARGYGQLPIIMRVWDVGIALIYLCGEGEFQNLAKGIRALSPIGFPKEDVFKYDPNLAEALKKSRRINWSNLE